MKKLKYIVFIIYGVLMSFVSFAQSDQRDEVPQMADALRSNGKIYVVVAVVITLFIGLLFYLMQLDRKIKKMEKDSAKKLD